MALTNDQIADAIALALRTDDAILARGKGKAPLAGQLTDLAKAKAVYGSADAVAMMVRKAGGYSGTAQPNVPNPITDTQAPFTPPGFTAVAGPGVSNMTVSCDQTADMDDETGQPATGNSGYQFNVDGADQTAIAAPNLNKIAAPTLWQVGSYSPAPTVSRVGQLFTLTSAGTGFSGTGDQLALHGWEVTGTAWVLTAYIADESGAGYKNAPSGIMWRETTAANVATDTTCRAGACYRYLSDVDALRVKWNLSVGAGTTLGVEHGGQPGGVYIQARRNGTTISYYGSWDGFAWILIDTKSHASLSSTLVIGRTLSDLDLSNVITSSGWCYYTLGAYAQVSTTVAGAVARALKVRALDSRSPIPNASLWSSTLTGTPSSSATLAWLAPTGALSPVLPGMPASHGMESLFSFTGTEIDIFVDPTWPIDQAVAAVSGKPAGHYTAGIRAAVRDSRRRRIWWIASGAYSWNGELDANYPYMAIMGQLAPSPGAHGGLNACIRLNSNDQLLWHWQNVSGNVSPDPLVLGNQDAIQLGDGDRQVVAWSSGTAAVDESFEGVSNCKSGAIVHSRINFALCNAGHGGGPDDVTHGTGIILAYGTKNILVARNSINHVNYRGLALCKATGCNLLDNGVYNVGAKPYMTQYAAAGELQGGDPGSDNDGVAIVGNAEANIFLLGPDSIAHMPFSVYGNPFAAGSKWWFADNQIIAKGPAASAWAGINESVQSTMVQLHISVPTGFMATSRNTAVFPSGYRTTKFTPTDGTPAALLESKRKKFELLRRTTGARPLDRAAGYDATYAFHPENYIADSGDPGTLQDDLKTMYSVAHNVIDWYSPTAFSTSAGLEGFPLDPNTFEANGKIKALNLAIRMHAVVAG